MMLSNAEDVEADTVSGDNLLDKFGHAIRRRRKLTCRRIREDGCKTIDTNFHETSLQSV